MFLNAADRSYPTRIGMLMEVCISDGQLMVTLCYNFHPVDLFRIFEKVIVAQLIIHVGINKNTACNAYAEAQQVDNAV